MRQIMIAIAAVCAILVFLPSKARAQMNPIPPPAPGPFVAGPPIHGPYPPWWLLACPASIIFSAAVAANRDHRELTYWEAYTCGVLYWFGQPPKQYVRKIK
jgi:hypothetical protein